MYGTQLKQVTKILYLGITVDDRLSFNEHINNKIEAASTKLCLLKQKLLGAIGPSPKWLTYAYNNVVLPSLTNAAHVWFHKLTAHHKKKLINLNRQFCKLITSFVGNPPTEGLEVILGARPLDLVIESAALRIMLQTIGKYKTSWNTIIPQGRTCKRAGFRYAIELAAIKYNIPLTTTDRTNCLSIYSALQEEELTHPDITVYTDGSKMENKVGYGATITGSYNNQIKGSLASEATVFQAEIQAIQSAARDLIDEQITGQVINIYSDSMAAINAIKSIHIKSKLVGKTRTTLNILASKNLTNISWVKAHVGIEGNEVADQLAKAGRHHEKTDTLVPLSYIKNKLIQASNNMWSKRWQSSVGKTQTKHWIPTINYKLHKEIILLDKETLNLVTQFVTVQYSGQVHWKNSQLSN
jgi:ribonuclease HI